MTKTVSLQDIVSALESHTQDTEIYLDRESGEILFVTEEDRFALDEDDPESVPQWQREHLSNIREAFATERVVQLPDAFDIHDWAIMERFSRTIADPKVQDELTDAIHGSGAFRMFRSSLERHNLREEWYSYRQSALEEIAREWCQENNIPFE